MLVHVSASALKDERGQLAGMLVIARDLSKKHEAERAMRQLATIVESSTDAIVNPSATLAVSSRGAIGGAPGGAPRCAPSGARPD